MGEQTISEDERPHTWLDAFPWLKGVTREKTISWWEDPIDDLESAKREKRLEIVADLALERLTGWSIGQIFPGLPADQLLDYLDLSARALNALKREGCVTCGDLAGVPLDMLLDWRNVGLRTAHEILHKLANASTSASTPMVMNRLSLLPNQLPNPDGDELAPGWIVALVHDLTSISKWLAATGHTEQPVLNESLISAAPKDLEAAYARLAALRPADVLDQDELAVDVAQLFDNALSLLDSRAVRVLSDRIFADAPLTLDEIGRREGLTRERIRQIEGKARGELLSFLAGNQLLSDVAAAARALIGPLFPLADLLRLIPALNNYVKAVGQPAWRVLDRLDDAYEIEDGWCAAPTIAAAESATLTELVELSDTYGVVRLEDVDLVSTKDAVRRLELNAAWLAHCGGYVIDENFVLIRTNSVADYGAAVLSLVGNPMSCQEILDRFVFPRTPGSLRNAMSIDERFERVDRDRWALKEWGLEAYSGIRSLIRQEVATSHGRIPLSELIERITGQYSVTASSVTTYASSPPFELRDGDVRLAESGRQVRKAPEATRRLFRRPKSWAYRVRVTKEHLRGSGSIAPVAIATILGMEYGDTRKLESALGPQTITWTGAQPIFGTIRRFLMDNDISADSEAFLVIHDDGYFTFEPVRPLTGDKLADGLGLIGADECDDVGKARQSFAAAVGLSPESPLSSVIAAFRNRGDGDLADMLTDLRAVLDQESTGTRGSTPAVDIEAILDLL